MLVVKSIDSFETPDAPVARIIKAVPNSMEFTRGPISFHPDDLPPVEEIPCVRFYSGRRAAEGRDPMVSICFSQKVFEKIGFLLDIAIYPNKEVESLRAAATKETARARELKSDLEIAEKLNNQHIATISSQRSTIEKLVRLVVAATDDYIAASDDLRTAALLPFWQRLKFLLGWSLRDLVEATNKRATPKRLTDDTPPETDAAAAPSRRTSPD